MHKRKDLPMFQKSEIKIVVTIMLMMVAMLAITLIVIYATSAGEIYQENQERLEAYIDAYEENGNPDSTSEGGSDAKGESDGAASGAEAESYSEKEPLPDENAPDENAPADRAPEELPADDPPDRVYALSTFYSVLFLGDEVTEIDNSDDLLYSNEQITDFALAILSAGKEKGTYRNLVYRVAEISDGSTLVVMMDNTVVDQSVFAFLRYTLLFGGLACVVIGILSFFLARRIVRPLRDNYDMQKRFISDAGHELKTPVSAIGANLDILKRQVGESQWIDNIEYENRRMGGIVKQLLELSRAENAVSKKEKIDFSRIVLSEALSFESVAFERGLTLDYEAVSEGIIVCGNEEQLSQLASILLDNAVSHADTSISDRIEVSLCEKHGRAYFTVCNAGAEIPEEERKHIFERFYRSDQSRSGNGEHYGLGLSIAKAIVLAHRGSIGVECSDRKVLFTASLKAD